MISLIVSLAFLGQITSYVDAEGTTHYVDSPAKIPAKYRKKAKPLEGSVSTVERKKLTEEEERRAKWAGETREKQAEQPARVVAPRPASSLTPQQEARKKYDESSLKTECYGDKCIVRPGTNTQALKAGESCRGAGASCTLPPECCSHACNPTTFTCE